MPGQYFWVARSGMGYLWQRLGRHLPRPFTRLSLSQLICSRRLVFLKYTSGGLPTYGSTSLRRMTEEATPAAYISPVAEPLLDGKALKRSLKLIQLASTREREERSKSKEGSRPKKNIKLLRRGVHEVTKSLRNGEVGLVFLASDVFPIEICAHLPILCEEKNVPYAYICSKKSLGHAFKSKRPASVIMITNPPEEGEEDEDSLGSVYKKVCKMIRKSHPYM